MRNELPGSASYPPGVRESDISYDEPVPCEACRGEGEVTLTVCCGRKFIENARGYHCERCHQQYNSHVCPECDGDGVA